MADRERVLTKGKSAYRCLRFILASAAQCERLFSKEDALVVKRRSGLTPLMVEALLYLKEDCHYWGIETVVESLKRTVGNLRNERLAKKMVRDEAEVATDEAAQALEALSVRVQADYHL